ncbi:hypothetical protein D3C80_1233530 [compost metagenome]
MTEAERAATRPGVLDDGVVGQRQGRCGHGSRSLNKTLLFLWDSADPCRSELARDARESAAFTQAALVNVNVHREQARSYRGREQSVECCSLLFTVNG